MNRSTVQVDPDAIGRLVLEIVRELVAELDVGLSRGAITLDSTLDRELSIGSLERVELLLRLEQACGVRLADAVMAGAETPRQLVEAILTAGPAVAESLPQRHEGPGAGAVAPAGARTLVEALGWHVEATPERVHIVLREEDGTERPITYAELWTQSMAVARGLRAGGLRHGECVALLLRTEEAFFPSFFGILLAGGVPVPLYPPFRADLIEEYARRQVGILRNADARVLITFAQAERVAGLLRAQVPSLKEITTIEPLAQRGGGGPLPRVTGDDLALIQYTSGSTGHPKGVALSHANVLANVRAIGHAVAIRPGDVAVSWLPLYHDMGLIGSWFTAMHFAVPIVILSPLAFLSRPARWLQAFHAHRGSLAAAPNFAFDLCVRKIADDEIQGLDLSSWRLALNGAEAVSPDTIARFTGRFGPYGFGLQTMVPVYGLAESTVALTVPPLGRPPRVDRVSRDSFQRAKQATPAPAAEPNPLQFVSCGRPIIGHEVRVVDAAGRPVPERVEGQIEFRGPSSMQGYYRNPEATREVMRDDCWIDSGDLGYWADDELFITGRRKDVIIAAGRNIYPQEVEEVAGEVPGIRKGCVAAFAIQDPQIGTERIVVIAETREDAPERRERLRVAVVDAVVTAIGVPPDIVVIAGPGAVLKTSSGKIRRGATRDAYLRGDLARRHSIVAQWGRLVAADLRWRFTRARDRGSAITFTLYIVALLVVAVPPFWLLVMLLPAGRPLDRLIRFACRAVLQLGVRLRVEGMERVGGSSPVVLVANHASFLDAVVLMAILPAHVRFVAKGRLVTYPIVGTVIQKAGYLPIARGHLAGAEEVVAAVRRGTSLAIFPEGTFVRAPGILPFRLGAFRAAVEGRCPVVPMGIRGTREVWPDETWLLRPGVISVTIGEPIRPEGDGWPEIVRLRDLARVEIARLSGERPVDHGPILVDAEPRPADA